MTTRVLPITQVKPDLKDAVRMSVAEVERFLAMFYPIDKIRQHESALAITGQWLSRVKGFHDDDDFLHLVRDFLSWVLSGGKRSLASDHLSLHFSGFMPSYGAARTFLGIVNDGGNWLDVRAFMHSQAYGNAKQYVETWSGGAKKAQAEAQAWLDVLKAEEGKLSMAAMLAGMALPVPKLPETGVAANDPVFPKPPPELKLVPPAEAPAVGAAGETGLARLLALARTAGPWIVAIELFTHMESAGESEADLAELRKRQDAAAKQGKLAIPVPRMRAKVVVNTANNECKSQWEKNHKNGAKCEEDGYVLMERELAYERLVDPPKGQGLDGLFEKRDGTLELPKPMPPSVERPKPGGKLVFIPEAKRPPQPQYPRFVVFEGKHISKSFRADDTEGIKKEAQRRLGETCDGTQMSVPWTEERIPQALDRSVRNGDMTRRERDEKEQQIRDNRYARWIFVCLPGTTGPSSKLFVLIDVVAAGMNLEKPSQSATSQSDTDTSGSFE